MREMGLRDATARCSYFALLGGFLWDALLFLGEFVWLIGFLRLASLGSCLGAQWLERGSTTTSSRSTAYRMSY